MTEIERIRINTSIPVSILELPNSNFNQAHQNDFVTHAKLKIFYVGQTADGRMFTKDFSEKLIKTLPQSPVVGYYDENDEDFKAHNHKQYVYGYVPETAEISFDEEEDKIWAYTDVILFTGRKDNIGEVASKIIGMQHSLELDPDSVQYVINRDENGKFKNVEFIDGKFIGLSVVGNSEKPAFTGSHFFTIENEDEMFKAFKGFQKDINAYFAKNKTDASSTEGSEDGGVQMEDLTKTVEDTNTDANFVEGQGEAEGVVEENTNTPDTTPEAPVIEDGTKFMRTPYDEVQDSVMKQFRESYGDYVYVVQWSSVEDVIVYWDGSDGNYYRITFVMGEDETIEFGEEKVQVKPRYLSQEEIESTFTDGTDTATETDPETVKDENVVLTEQQGPIGEVGEKGLEGTEGIVEDESIGTVGEGEVNDGKTEEAQKGLLLTESEAEQLEKDMAELQTFRRQEKELMIQEFTDLITAEDLKAISDLVDKFSKEDLEMKLSVAAMRKMKAEKESGSTISAMKFYESNQNENQQNQDPTLELINRWKDKK